MEKNNNLREYLKKLELLESEINDDSDPDELMKEVNDIIGNISKDIQVEVKELALFTTLKYVNKSNNPDPEFTYEGDSGFDLRAYLKDDEEVIVPPGRVRVISTGLYVEVEKGLEVQVRSRSGLAANKHIFVLNSPGTVDSHYRDEIKIILANFGDESFGDNILVVKNGDRIAQGVVCPVYGEGKLNLVKVNELSTTERNLKGFGSSGSK